MRWILVFIFLYLIPLIIVFKNYNNFKRSCIYSSIYVVLVTTIAISNIYMSGLNKIEEAMYYQHYASEYIYKQKTNEKNDSPDNEKTITEQKPNKSKTENKIEAEVDTDDIKIEETINESTQKEVTPNKSDMELIDSFKENIYEIEKIALIPMRDCMPYTKNISANLRKLADIRKDLDYARQKCKEAIKEYENMDIPTLTKEDYTNVLDSARNDLIKTYELREKAMESSLELVDTKNPKYIGRVTECLKLSDEHITSFKDRINALKNEIESSNNN